MCSCEEPVWWGYDQVRRQAAALARRRCGRVPAVHRCCCPTTRHHRHTSAPGCAPSRQTRRRQNDQRAPALAEVGCDRVHVTPADQSDDLTNTVSSFLTAHQHVREAIQCDSNVINNVSVSMSRSSYVCRHTSVCTVWHPTTYRASARYWPPFLAVLCYVQLTQTNCWYHGPARPALDCIPSVLLVWNDMPAHLHNLEIQLLYGCMHSLKVGVATKRLHSLTAAGWYWEEHPACKTLQQKLPVKHGMCVYMQL